MTNEYQTVPPPLWVEIAFFAFLFVTASAIGLGLAWVGYLRGRTRRQRLDAAMRETGRPPGMERHR